MYIPFLLYPVHTKGYATDHQTKQLLLWNKP